MGDDKSNPDTPLDPMGMLQAEYVTMHEMYLGARQGGFSWLSALGLVAWIVVVNGGKRPEDT